MLDEKMHKALEKQVNAEMYSGYMYLSMSSYLSGKGLEGFANWMRIQAQEELVHAMKIYDFIIERGETVELGAIEGPPTSWESPLEVLEETAKHERKVTSMINDLVNLAMELRDHATNNFLQWFVAEQVEEEASADGLVDKMKLVEETKGGIFMLDKELASRQPIFTLPGENE